MFGFKKRREGIESRLKKLECKHKQISFENNFPVYSHGIKRCKECLQVLHVYGDEKKFLEAELEYEIKSRDDKIREIKDKAQKVEAEIRAEIQALNTTKE